MFNVAIIGGEGLNDYYFCQAKCIACLKNKAESREPITIFSTGDAFVDLFSNKFHINVQYFYTNWRDDGKNALKARNERLLEKCNAMIVFNDNTKETRILHDLAKSKGIPVRFFSKPIT